MLVQYLCCTVSFKGQSTRQQFIQNHTQRIDVGPGIDIEIVELSLFGSGILPGADEGAVHPQTQSALVRASPHGHHTGLSAGFFVGGAWVLSTGLLSLVLIHWLKILTAMIKA